MEYEGEKKERLGKLEKKLYSRNAPDIIDKGRSEFVPKEESHAVDMSIQMEEEPKTDRFDELAARMARAAQSKHSFVNKIFIVSLSFFVIAAGVAAFVFLGGSNLVSSRNVDIQVVGPLSVPGGQEVSLDINIINNNNVDLNSASLLVEYPEGVRSSSDLSKDLTSERFVLGDIKSKESYGKNLKIVFLGDKDTVRQIKLTLEYRVENSSALFYKEKTYEAVIGSAPVIITPTYPKEVNSNQDISFDVEIASNSKDTLDNFLVNVNYPFGFVFKSSSPVATFGNNIWRFYGLKPGEKRKISITGNIIGQDNEEKVFRITAGSASENDERVIAVPLSDLTESVMVKKPFIGVDTSIAGQKGDAMLKGGVSADISFDLRNNLPSKLFNVSVEASFSGGAFDKLGIAPNSGGFFQSSNNTVLWDKRSVPDFSEMAPGSAKSLSLQLSPLQYSKVAKGSAPEIYMNVKVTGDRILDSGSTDKVSVTETRKITLLTDVILSSKSARSLGNLENSGPIPPKVDTPTTYTIIWSISNSFNQVSNAEVRATIPSYMKWKNLYSPQSESIKFDSTTNEVVWSAGSILANTGFGTSPKTVYFQLEFLPSSSQIGETPPILGDASLTGIDKATGAHITASAPAVSTAFTSDPTFKNGDDKVGQ